MTELLFARAQMATLFVFHMLFAVAGMGMPLLMVIAEWHHLRTGRIYSRDLARRWARGTAVLFAVGAVSGTMLSFELGLLWPRFMTLAGGIIGLPFALEGFAFFAEAIFLGIYLYGWDRIPPKAHLLAGVIVSLGGLMSGILVVTANGWMNSPAGFVLRDGVPTQVDPVAAMFNPAWRTETLHMTLAAYVAIGFAVAGIHAWCLLKDRENPFHRLAMKIALATGCAAALVQPLSGDMSARFVARDQPAKLAAMEGQFRTERGAPLRIGGIPDPAAGATRHAIEIPRGLSLLAFHDLNAEVQGLEAVPPADRPNPLPVHAAFQVMVACGSVMALLSLVVAWRAWKSPDRLFDRGFLRAVAAAGPLGLVAMEAGWFVTETGRQPWVIRGILRTSDAVTPVEGLAIPFGVITVVYLALGLAAVWLLRREVSRSPAFAGDRTPEKPRPGME